MPFTEASKTIVENERKLLIKKLDDRLTELNDLIAKNKANSDKLKPDEISAKLQKYTAEDEEQKKLEEADLAAQLLKLQDDKSIAENKFGALKKDGVLQKKIKDLDQAIQELDEKLTASNTKLDALVKSENPSKQDVTTLNEQISMLETQKNSRKTTYNKLKEEQDTLEAKLNEFNREITEKENKQQRLVELQSQQTERKKNKDIELANQTSVQNLNKEKHNLEKEKSEIPDIKNRFLIPLENGFADDNKENEYNQLMGIDSEIPFDAAKSKLTAIHDETDKKTKALSDPVKNQIKTLHDAQLNALENLKNQDQSLAFDTLQAMLSSSNKAIGVTIKGNSPYQATDNEIKQFNLEFRHNRRFIAGNTRVELTQGGAQAYNNNSSSIRAAVCITILSSKNPHLAEVLIDNSGPTKNIAAKEALRLNSNARILFPDAEGMQWNQIFEDKSEISKKTKLYGPSVNIELLKKYNADDATVADQTKTKMIFSALTADSTNQVFAELRSNAANHVYTNRLIPLLVPALLEKTPAERSAIFTNLQPKEQAEVLKELNKKGKVFKENAPAPRFEWMKKPWLKTFMGNNPNLFNQRNEFDSLFHELVISTTDEEVGKIKQELNLPHLSNIMDQCKKEVNENENRNIPQPQ